jgi:N-acetylmuramoyl-L-alanine amidase
MTKLRYLILSNIKLSFFNVNLTLLILFIVNTNINGKNPGNNIIYSENINIHPDSVFTIVIDAGHGGKDKGTSYGNVYEKDITLAIAKKIKTDIEENANNIKVILTREKDSFIPLYKRVRIANRARADIFISIHCNSYTKNRNINGSEIYVMGLTDSGYNLDVAMRENTSVLLEGNYENNYDWFDPNSIEAHIFLSAFQNLFLDQSVALANKLSENLNKATGVKIRGVKQAGFVILKYATMPSILIETGFISNYNDRQNLKSEKGQYNISKSISESLIDYLNGLKL